MLGNDLLFFYLVVLIVLILIVTGILVWAVLSLAKKDRRGKSPPAGERTEAKLEAPPDVVLPTQDIELLSVFREAKSGLLYIEVEGRQYRQLTDIRNRETGRKVLQTVAELVRFTRGVTPAVHHTGSSSIPSPQKPSPGSLLNRQKDTTSGHSMPPPGSLAKRGQDLTGPPASSQPGSDPGPESEKGRLHSSRLLERTQQRLETPPDSGSKPHIPKAPTMSSPGEGKRNLGSFWSRALPRSTLPAGTVGPRPLADELEDLLREHRESLPEPLAKEVHFRTASDGSLVIEVDGVPHHGLEEVKDEEARDLIQAIIRKWERR